MDNVDFPLPTPGEIIKYSISVVLAIAFLGANYLWNEGFRPVVHINDRDIIAAVGISRKVDGEFVEAFVGLRAKIGDQVGVEYTERRGSGEKSWGHLTPIKVR